MTSVGLDPPSSPDIITLTPRGKTTVRSRHPWTYADHVRDVPAGVRHGDLCAVASGGKTIGHAFYSARSKIALRWVEWGVEPPDGRFWAQRLERALDHRRRVAAEAEAHRLIHGESDGFPGLIVDRYGPHLVVQALLSATERRLEGYVSLLETFLGPETVLARNDSAARRLEGLDREVRQLRGTTPDVVEAREGPVRFRVDLWRGQKTGAFLDQRENRLAMKRYARGRVLDAFCYEGMFGLHCAAAAAADQIECVDSSARATEAARLNAGLNERANVEVRTANVFHELRALEKRGERFDLVVLDPPAFAKSRRDVPAARRGYREINLRAMRLLVEGGVLVSSSCSYNMKEGDFLEVLQGASSDAAIEFRVVERRGQSRDHPVLINFPESRYLKCVILERT